MTDIHVTTTQLSGPGQSSATGSPATPGAAVFAALLSGQLASSPAENDPAEAPHLSGAAIAPTVNPAGGVQPTSLSDATDDKDTPQEPGHTEPDATTQLLMAIGALPATDVAKPSSVQESPGEPEAAPETTALPAALAATAGIQRSPTAGSATRATAEEAPKTAPGAQRADPRAAPPSSTLPDATNRDKPRTGEPGYREMASLLAASAPPLHTLTAADLPAAAATQSSASAAPAASAPPSAAHQMSVPDSVGSVTWREEFASSVNFLASRHISSAELRVEPAELGPIHVSIRIEAGEANITCVAQHADTRQALDAALPRLREMLEANGIAVGNASVGSQASGSGFSQTPSDDQVRRSGFASPVAEDEAAPVAGSRSHASQLVDIFA